MSNWQIICLSSLRATMFEEGGRVHLHRKRHACKPLFQNKGWPMPATSEEQEARSLDKFQAETMVMFVCTSSWNLDMGEQPSTSSSGDLFGLVKLHVKRIVSGLFFWERTPNDLGWHRSNDWQPLPGWASNVVQFKQKSLLAPYSRRYGESCLAGVPSFPLQLQRIQ